MCGIFGIVNSQQKPLNSDESEIQFQHLFKLSESRGKEASGLAVLPTNQSGKIFVHRSAYPASSLVSKPEYQSFKSKVLEDSNGQAPVAIFGHTRLVTNGNQTKPENNQPVVFEGLVAVHNGIIVNSDKLWEDIGSQRRSTEVDTEVLLALIRDSYQKTNLPITAVRQAFERIIGTASVSVFFNDLNILVLATNNGSLYFAKSEKNECTYFASEKSILQAMAEKMGWNENVDFKIQHLNSGQGMVVHLGTSAHHYFPLNSKVSTEPQAEIETAKAEPRQIDISNSSPKVVTAALADSKFRPVPAHFDRYFEKMQNLSNQLVRCIKCNLPETIPFIQFTSEGICSYCTYHKPVEFKGRAALEDNLRPYRRSDDQPECLFSISGGRDSCFALHYMVKELGIKPLAYTYDWGMVTDLARRNIARFCGELGVEHIILSADIAWKRKNIQMNINAWMKSPHLGMIPLFMAGDKQLFWFAYKLKKQNGLDLDIFAMNKYENTQFKEDFTGIKFWEPGRDSNFIGPQMNKLKSLQLLAFYGMQFGMNTGYWNRSLWDSFTAYLSYYFTPTSKQIVLFDYIPWKETEINDVIINQYDFELAPDTSTTWRIGDGTASFYNYIYYVRAGFSEHDTMRANQIRAGMITLEEAKALVARDNRPRWQSFQWYCDVVGLDFEQTVEAINKMPKASPKLAI